jgi:hypothetical protein
MKPVKSQPRFRCDFCSKTLTKSAMERHEEICYKNPERKCPICEDGSGCVWVAGDGITEPAYYEDCQICSTIKQHESNNS